MTTASLITAIETAADLRNLHAALREAEDHSRALFAAVGEGDCGLTDAEDFRDRLARCYEDLPTWGAEYQGDTEGVASWNETHVLMVDDLHLEPRGDIAHTMPAAWRCERHTGVWYLLAGEHADDAIMASVSQAEDGSWWVVVEGGGCERWEENGCETSREAAEAGGDHIGWYVSQDAAPDAVVALLKGTQESKASRIGVSQPTVQGWQAGTHEMSRVARHSVLAQLGAVRSVNSYEPMWVWR